MEIIYKKNIKDEVDEAIYQAHVEGKEIEKIRLESNSFDKFLKAIRNETYHYIEAKPSVDDPLAFRTKIIYKQTVIERS